MTTTTTTSPSNLPTIVIDTREKLPYGFDPGQVTTIRRALPAGDYSLEGHQQQVAIERKSMADLVGTITRGRRRFMRELQALRDYRFAVVVIEGNFRDAALGNYQGRLHPNALIGTTMSIHLDFGVPVLWLGDRQAAAQFTQRFLIQAAKRLEGLEDQK